MLIWILAILLFGAFALAGYTLGAVRLAASLLGLLLGSLLAVPLGGIFQPLLRATGVANPVLLWLLGPFVAFVVILIACKVAGVIVNKKVEIHYKYNAGDVHIGLWNRLNPRLGLALGLMNAAVYLILISWVVYVFSYVTFQMVTPDSAVAWEVRLLDAAGEGLQSSGMAKVAAAVDSMPETYYEAADVVGMIYHNDLLEGRLSRYPAFMDLGETPQFQDIGNDKEFTELRQKQPPMADILNHPKAQSIVNNPAMLREIWGIASPNLADLEAFLKTGHSARYNSEKILGRWDLNVGASLNLLKRTKPKIPFKEMQYTKMAVSLVFANTTFVAGPEPAHLAVLRNLGKLRPPAKPNLPPTVDMETFKGQWSSDSGKYQLSFPDKGRGSLEAAVDGDRLTITGDTYPMVFDRE